MTALITLGYEPFFSEESYKKYSVCPSFLDLIKQKDVEINGPIESQHESKKAKNDPVKKDPSTQWQEVLSREKKEKKKPEQVHTPYLYPAVAFPRLSWLTKDEQKKYLELTEKYGSPGRPVGPGKGDHKELLLLRDLQGKVLGEQAEYVTYLQTAAYKLHKDYLHISDDADSYVSQLLDHGAQRVKTYPQFYVQHDSVSIRTPRVPRELHFFHLKTLLNLGTVPEYVPTIGGKKSLKNKLKCDIKAIRKKFLPNPSKVTGKQVCSEDETASHLAVTHRVQVVISSSALSCLVDNHEPYHRQWEIPVVVREIQQKLESGEVHSQKVVFIDKPFVQKQMTVRERNHLFHKVSLKYAYTNTTHTGSFRRVPHTNGSDMEFKHRDEDLYKKRQTDVESYGDDAFLDDHAGSGDVVATADIEDLETFGTGPCKRPKLNLSENLMHKKGAVSKSPKFLGKTTSDSFVNKQKGKEVDLEGPNERSNVAEDKTMVREAIELGSLEKEIDESALINSTELGMSEKMAPMLDKTVDLENKNIAGNTTGGITMTDTEEKLLVEHNSDALNQKQASPVKARGAASHSLFSPGNSTCSESDSEALFIESDNESALKIDVPQCHGNMDEDNHIPQCDGSSEVRKTKGQRKLSKGQLKTRKQTVPKRLTKAKKTTAIIDRPTASRKGLGGSNKKEQKKDCVLSENKMGESCENEGVLKKAPQTSNFGVKKLKKRVEIGAGRSSDAVMLRGRTFGLKVRKVGLTAAKSLKLRQQLQKRHRVTRVKGFLDRRKVSGRKEPDTMGIEKEEECIEEVKKAAMIGRNTRSSGRISRASADAGGQIVGNKSVKEKPEYLRQSSRKSQTGETKSSVKVNQRFGTDLIGETNLNEGQTGQQNDNAGRCDSDTVIKNILKSQELDAIKPRRGSTGKGRRRSTRGLPRSAAGNLKNSDLENENEEIFFKDSDENIVSECDTLAREPKYLEVFCEKKGVLENNVKSEESVLPDVVVKEDIHTGDKQIVMKRLGRPSRKSLEARKQSQLEAQGSNDNMDSECDHTLVIEESGTVVCNDKQIGDVNTSKEGNNLKGFYEKHSVVENSVKSDANKDKQAGGTQTVKKRRGRLSKKSVEERKVSEPEAKGFDENIDFKCVTLFIEESSAIVPDRQIDEVGVGFCEKQGFAENRVKSEEGFMPNVLLKEDIHVGDMQVVKKKRGRPSKKSLEERKVSELEATMQRKKIKTQMSASSVHSVEGNTVKEEKFQGTESCVQVDRGAKVALSGNSNGQPVQPKKQGRSSRKSKMGSTLNGEEGTIKTEEGSSQGLVNQIETTLTDYLCGENASGTVKGMNTRRSTRSSSSKGVSVVDVGDSLNGAGSTSHNVGMDRIETESMLGGSCSPDHSAMETTQNVTEGQRVSVEDGKCLNNEELDTEPGMVIGDTGDSAVQLEELHAHLDLSESESDVEELLSPGKKSRRLYFSDEDSEEEERKRAQKAQKKWIDSVRQQIKTTQPPRRNSNPKEGEAMPGTDRSAEPIKKPAIKVKSGTKKIFEDMDNLPAHKPARKTLPTVKRKLHTLPKYKPQQVEEVPAITESLHSTIIGSTCAGKGGKTGSKNKHQISSEASINLQLQQRLMRRRLNRSKLGQKQGEPHQKLIENPNTGTLINRKDSEVRYKETGRVTAVKEPVNFDVAPESPTEHLESHNPPLSPTPERVAALTPNTEMEKLMGPKMIPLEKLSTNIVTDQNCSERIDSDGNAHIQLKFGVPSGITPIRSQFDHQTEGMRERSASTDASIKSTAQKLHSETDASLFRTHSVCDITGSRPPVIQRQLTTNAGHAQARACDFKSNISSDGLIVPMQRKTRVSLVTDESSVHRDQARASESGNLSPRSRNSQQTKSAKTKSQQKMKNTAQVKTTVGILDQLIPVENRPVMAGSDRSRSKMNLKVHESRDYVNMSDSSVVHVAQCLLPGTLHGSTALPTGDSNNITSDQYGISSSGCATKQSTEGGNHQQIIQHSATQHALQIESQRGHPFHGGSQGSGSIDQPGRPHGEHVITPQRATSQFVHPSQSSYPGQQTLYQAPVHIRDPKEWEMYEDPKDFKPPATGNLTYNVWQLGKLKVLIRCSLHTVKPQLHMDSQVKFLHFLPKLEYQRYHGYEQHTLSETSRSWMNLAVRPRCNLFRVRVAEKNSEVLAEEEVDISQVLGSSTNFSPKASLDVLEGVFNKLCSLHPGHYLLGHAPGNTQAHIKKTTQSQVGVYNLHVAYDRLHVDRESVPWIPVDPGIKLQFHRHHHRVPCTFEPKDTDKPFFKRDQDDKKFKGKKTKGKKNNSHSQNTSGKKKGKK